MARICYGEFDFPERNGRQAYIRSRFLGAIEIYAPEVCSDLYDSAFAAYLDFIAAYPELDWFSAELGDAQTHQILPGRAFPNPSLNRWLTAEAFADFDSETELEIAPDSKVTLLNRALTAWAANWHLESVWVFNCALKTLDRWSVLAEKAPEQWSFDLERPTERLHFSRLSWGGLHHPAVASPPDGLPDYEPLAVTRTSYLSRVRTRARDAASTPILKLNDTTRQNAVEAAVARGTEYCETVEAAYEQDGFARCRSNEKRNLKDHLEWTVRFQVKGETLTTIGTASDVESSTVLRAVNDLFTLIGLAKRADAHPGRRRGSQNSPESKVRSETLRRLGR